MKQNIDKMIVILPFEKDYYKNKWNWDVEYVGHPLVQVIEEFKSTVNSQPQPMQTVCQPSTANDQLALLLFCPAAANRKF